MKLRKTDRGFEIAEWDDRNGEPCSLQQSSIIGDYPDAWERPGTSALWLGKGDGRMHLSREQAAGLRDRLAAWLESGSLRLPGDPEPVAQQEA